MWQWSRSLILRPPFLLPFTHLHCAKRIQSRGLKNIIHFLNPTFTLVSERKKLSAGREGGKGGRREHNPNSNVNPMWLNVTSPLPRDHWWATESSIRDQDSIEWQPELHTVHYWTGRWQPTRFTLNVWILSHCSITSNLLMQVLFIYFFMF